MVTERLRGRHGDRINYRPLIWSLVRKPGAFGGVTAAYLAPEFFSQGPGGLRQFRHNPSPRAAASTPVVQAVVCSQVPTACAAFTSTCWGFHPLGCDSLSGHDRML